jgi:tetratricopeptide (TPR) repeat protein
MYDKAIHVYTLLSSNYPESEFALDAVFAIGLCYEKLGKHAEMAAVFTDFARKYEGDHYKQIEALVKAGDAYYNLDNYKEAQKDYELAGQVYDKYKGKTDINIASIAQAYYMQGEIRYKTFAAIGLQGTPKQVKENLKLKEKALNDAAAPYKKAIEVGVGEWTLRATFKLGMGFVDFADAIENQSIEGTTDQKIAAKVSIYMDLNKYYTTAMKFFEKNIEWSYAQNITGEYVVKSLDMYMKMLFQRANSIEKVGTILKTSPVPKDLAPDEQQSYKELLEEKSLEAMDKALPLYEEAVKAAVDLGIADNMWLDKVRDRIREINPASEALTVKIVPHEFKITPPAVAVTDTSAAAALPKGSEVQAQAPVLDDHFQRTMKRIDNIIQLDVPQDDKVKQLKRVDSETQKEIQAEMDLIEQLKKQQ